MIGLRHMCADSVVCIRGFFCRRALCPFFSGFGEVRSIHQTTRLLEIYLVPNLIDRLFLIRLEARTLWALGGGYATDLVLSIHFDNFSGGILHFQISVGITEGHGKTIGGRCLFFVFFFCVSGGSSLRRLGAERTRSCLPPSLFFAEHRAPSHVFCPLSDRCPRGFAACKRVRLDCTLVRELRHATAALCNGCQEWTAN